LDEYKHYYRLDAAGTIVTYAFSTAFEQPQDGDYFVEYGGRHFNPVITNDRGQYTLKRVDGAIVQRTQAELDAEWAARPPAPETDAEKIARLEAEKDDLKRSLAQLNGDMSAFIDFYFSVNPEQS